MKSKIISIILFLLLVAGAKGNQVYAVDVCSGDHQITLEAGCGCDIGYHSDTLDPIECVPNETPTPTLTPAPTPTPVACESTEDGTPGPWVYAIGGASRSRTVPLVDSNTDEDCGSKVETQYPYCVPIEDGSYTNWYAVESQPDGSTPGQCGGGYSTITICYQDETKEVFNNGEELSSYHGYTVGACPTPTPPPSNGGGPGDGLSDGRSDGGSSCASCTAPPVGKVLGASTDGQVLGATTDVLAATGSNYQLMSTLIGATVALAVFLLGQALLRDHETS